MSKVKFLSNTLNKEKFLGLLKTYLIARGINVLSSTADADVLMCREAVERSYESDVSLVGDDTDLLIILLHMTRHQAFDHKLFLTTKHHVYDIEDVRNKLGQNTVNSILLAHAFTGCDTTSRIHGVGKDKLFKILNSVESGIVETFYTVNSSVPQVKAAGEQLFLQLISSSALSLDESRLAAIEQKASSSSSDIKCQQLPPTTSAAEQHSYRVYLQIQEWNEISGLKAEAWGWRFKNEEYLPVTSLMAAAPKELLDNIHCSCTKSGCTSSCSCRKANLPCGAACLKCQDNCTNQPSQEPTFN